LVIINSKCVIPEEKTSLCVILLIICPIEFYFFAVIRNGIFMPFYGVAILWDKITFFIKTGEEIIEIVKNL